jgi:hypothetical protein
MGSKRGTGRGSFIDSILEAVDTFYIDVLQQLKTWTVSAPKLRDEPETPGVPAALVSTALSSQDEPEPAISPKPERTGQELDRQAGSAWLADGQSDGVGSEPEHAAVGVGSPEESNSTERAYVPSTVAPADEHARVVPAG